MWVQVFHVSWPFFMTHVYIKGDDNNAVLPQDYFTGIPMVTSMKGLWEAVVLKWDVQCSVHFERMPCSLRLDKDKGKD